MKLLEKINLLLINYFGVPPRSKKLPATIDLLIATILSQNTNDKNSFRAFQNLKNNFNSWNEVRNSEISNIENTIKIAGLGFQKASAIKNLLEELYISESNYKMKLLAELSVEDSINYLTKFKGIGVKTASCVLLFSMDRNVCPVDTHVNRTLNRIGVVKTISPDKTFFEINKNLPEGIAHSLHTNLIRLGREICKPKNYNCLICPLKKICKYEPKSFLPKNRSKDRSFMLLDNV